MSIHLVKAYDILIWAIRGVRNDKPRARWRQRSNVSQLPKQGNRNIGRVLKLFDPIPVLQNCLPT